MPSTIGESDIFTSAVQRPNNGESADAASLLQAFLPLTNRTRYNHNRSRTGAYDVMRAPFNAVGDDSADDYAAIIAAIAAAYGAGGGDVILPRRHRVSAKLALPAGVNLIGLPGWSRLTTTAAVNTVEVSSAVDMAPQSIEGIEFQTTVVNTASTIIDAASSLGRFKVFQCTFGNSTGGTGNHIELRSSSGASMLWAEGCLFTPRRDESIYLRTNGNQAIVTRNLFRYLNSGALGCARMDNINRLDFSHNTIDRSGSLGGGFKVDVAINDADGRCRAAANTFIGTAFSSHYAFSGPGLLLEHSNDYDANSKVDRYFGEFAQGSRIEDSLSYDVSIFGTTFTLPDGYGTYRINSTNATRPTLTVPTPFMVGQRMRIGVRNDSGTLWGATTLFTGANFGLYFVNTPSSQSNGSAIYYELEASRITGGALVWNVISVG